MYVSEVPVSLVMCHHLLGVVPLLVSLWPKCECQNTENHDPNVVSLIYVKVVSSIVDWMRVANNGHLK